MNKETDDWWTETLWVWLPKVGIVVQVRLQDTLFIAVDKEDVLVGKTILDSEKIQGKCIKEIVWQDQITCNLAGHC